MGPSLSTIRWNSRSTNLSLRRGAYLLALGLTGLQALVRWFERFSYRSSLYSRTRNPRSWLADQKGSDHSFSYASFDLRRLLSGFLRGFMARGDASIRSELDKPVSGAGSVDESSELNRTDGLRLQC